jgi:hypothetical protein
MLKIEYIWRELLYQAIEKRENKFKIIELAKKFNLSTSFVSHALLPLRKLNIVKVEKNNSHLTDVEKLLYFWATRRDLQKDVIYSTYSSLPVMERENSMPDGVFPTAYSAFRFYFGDCPSDYDKVYFYSFRLDVIKKRFPQNTKNYPNLFIIKPDPFFLFYKKTTLAQIFVDLWGLEDWYAKEFLEALLLKIKEQIGL